MKILGVDIETYDPQLKSLGSGARRDDTYVVGVALTLAKWNGKTYDVEESGYIPLRHQEQKVGEGWNDSAIAEQIDVIQSWIDEADGYIGANLIYDIEFLEQKEGLQFYTGTEYRHMNKKFIDVQVAEPVLDENKRGEYSLEDLAQHYQVGTKDDDELYAWLAENYGGQPTRAAQAGRIYLAPIDLVSKYALSDSTLPIRIFEKQLDLIKKRGLREIWDLERDLFPMLYEMKKRGVPIDVPQAHINQKQLDQGMAEAVQAVADASQGYVKLADAEKFANSTAQIAQVIDELNEMVEEEDRVAYPKTEKKAPSIRKDWLEAQAKGGPNPMINGLARAIADFRRVKKNSGTFIEGILKHTYDGKIHCQFNQLKSDQYGTVSGRFSSSNPNLQNQPARDEEMMPLVRGLYIPDPGCDWASADYSQIEYRLLIHHAYVHFARKDRDGNVVLYKVDEHGNPVLDERGRLQEDPEGEAIPASSRVKKEFRAAAEMRRRFIRGAETGEKVDVHEEVGEMCGIDRRDGKTINFGMVYGLGIDSLVASLGYARELCMQIMDAYHGNMPFAKKIYYEFNRIAKNTGIITTIGMRQRRFPAYNIQVPPTYTCENEDDEPPLCLLDYMSPPTEGTVWTRKKNKRTKIYKDKETLLSTFDEEDRADAERFAARAKCHTGLNALLQGGAADIMKRAMLAIWNAGICDILGAPHITVHDELNWSVPRTDEAREAFRRSVEIMEAVYSERLAVPLLVDYATGENWAQCK